MEKSKTEIPESNSYSIYQIQMQMNIVRDQRAKKLEKQMHALDAPIRVLVLVEKHKKKTQVLYICFTYAALNEIASKLKSVKNIILILSGKGGVGKSTISS